MEQPLFSAQNFPLADGLSLYYHIPFCKHKCFYCDFFSLTKTTAEEQLLFIKNIISQTEFLLNQLGQTKLATTYIGGGTPSLLANECLALLLEKTASYSPKELTIEANPEQITPDFLHLVADHGVNRLSLGLQTFNQKSLQQVGRYFAPINLHAKLELLAQTNLSINIDLIAGLPSQTAEDIVADIETIDQFGFDHISFYSLIIEEATPLAKMLKLLPNEEARDELWFTGHQHLQRLGYTWYEISNYAKNYAYSQHNMRYWQLKDFLAIGPSASSTLIKNDASAVRLTGKKQTNLWLTDNFTTNFEQYYDFEAISHDELFFEFLMMGLRCSRGIDLKRFEKLFKLKATRFLEQFKTEHRDIIEENANYLIIKPEARLYLNSLLATYI